MKEYKIFHLQLSSEKVNLETAKCSKPTALCFSYRQKESP